jgi:hypothetical protein
MLSPCMTLDHTYLTWSTYGNLSWVTEWFGQIPLLPRNRDSRLHQQHTGWSIYVSPHSQRRSRLKPSFCRWQATRLTAPIYQHAIGTFNTCSRGPTHRSSTDTRATTLEVLAFHIPLPDLPNRQSPLSIYGSRPVSGYPNLPKIPRFKFKDLWAPRGLSTTRPSTVTYNYT